MITIVLVDDHPVVRQGVRTVLEGRADYVVVGEAEDGLAALALVAALTPDLLILDLMLPGLNGLEVTRRVRATHPRTQVLLLSLHSQEPYVLEALRAGAAGYVLKSAPTAVLLEAVQTVVGGGRYLSPPLTERAIDVYVRKVDAAAGPFDGYKLLTAREREVLQLAAEGQGHAAIAERLTISPRTAETHRTNLMRKLGLRSQAELVHYAIRQGVIHPD